MGSTSNGHLPLEVRSGRGVLDPVGVEHELASVLCTSTWDTSTTTTMAFTTIISTTAASSSVFSSPDNAWLLYHTRDGDGQFTTQWQELSAGDFTVDVFIKIKSLVGVDVQTSMIGSDGTDHNTYSASNRRRNFWYGVKTDGTVISHLHCGSTADYRDHDNINVTDGQFHHLAIVASRSARVMQWWFDGELKSQASYNPGTDDCAMDGHLLVGGGILKRKLDCEVGTFRIWSRALSEEDIGNAQRKCDSANLSASYLTPSYHDSTSNGHLPLEVRSGRGVLDPVGVEHELASVSCTSTTGTSTTTTMVTTLTTTWTSTTTTSTTTSTTVSTTGTSSTSTTTSMSSTTSSTSSSSTTTTSTA